MSKKQTRRAISVCQETYEAIRKRAAETGTTGSGLVEMVLRKFLDLEDQKTKPPRIPRIAQRTPPTPKPTPVVVATPPLAKDLKKEPEIVIKKKEVEAPKPKEPVLGDRASSIFTF